MNFNTIDVSISPNGDSASSSALALTDYQFTSYRLSVTGNQGKVPLKFTYTVNRIVYRRLIRTDATNVQMQRYVRDM